MQIQPTRLPSDTLPHPPSFPVSERPLSKQHRSLSLFMTSKESGELWPSGNGDGNGYVTTSN